MSTSAFEAVEKIPADFRYFIQSSKVWQKPKYNLFRNNSHIYLYIYIYIYIYIYKISVLDIS